MTFRLRSGALVQDSNDLHMRFGCGFRVTVGRGLNAPLWVSGVVWVLRCGFRVTFGRDLGAPLWVSGDLRVRFGCSGVGFGLPSGAFRVL